MSKPRPDVFLSYSWGKGRLVQRRVMRFKNHLEKSYDVPIWMDTNQIEAGNQLSVEIEKGIRGCKVFVMCITSEYIVSENCMKEFNLAVALKKPILPILFEDLKWPPENLGFHLSASLYVNFKNAKTAEEGVDFWPTKEMACVILEIGKHVAITATTTSRNVSNSQVHSVSNQQHSSQIDSRLLEMQQQMKQLQEVVMTSTSSSTDITLLRGQLKDTQEKLERVEKDRNSGVERLQATRLQLENAESKVSKVLSDLETSKKEKVLLENDLKSNKCLLKSTQEQLKNAESRMSVFKEKNRSLEIDLVSSNRQISITQEQLQNTVQENKNLKSEVERLKLKLIEASRDSNNTSSKTTQSSKINPRNEIKQNLSKTISQDIVNSLISGYTDDELLVCCNHSSGKESQTISVKRLSGDLYKKIIFAHENIKEFTVAVKKWSNLHFLMGWAMNKDKSGDFLNGNRAVVHSSNKNIDNNKRFQSKQTTAEILSFPTFTNVGDSIKTTVDYEEKRIIWITQGKKLTLNFETIAATKNTCFFPALSIFDSESEIEISNIVIRD